MSVFLRSALLAFLFLGCGTTLPASVRTDARPAVVTMLDGDGFLLRDGVKLTVAEGVRVLAGDIVSTGPQARLLRIEFPDGVSVALGPRTQFLLEAPADASGSRATLYLLAGWVKLSTPAGVTSGLASPRVGLEATGDTAVLAVQPGSTQLFAESGSSIAHPRPVPGPARTLKSGQMLAWPADAAAPPTLTQGAAPSFVAALPRSFMDSLPARAAAFAGKETDAKPVGEMSYAEAGPWLDAEPSLRRLFVKRWRALADQPAFRRELVAGLKSHPEWKPVLFPPIDPARSPSTLGKP